MGGNKGKRTKGNVKPSSSGRSAELLSASGVSGFIGFSGLSTDLPGYVLPTGKHTDNEEIEAKVDDDFKLVLKKAATKRDSVTKIKALQEFSQLCQTKDDLTVKGVLPFWPRVYGKLAIDHNHRVRETAHQAQKSLIAKVKKNIAPFLKSLMGTWVVSMCDLYAPAASTAKQAFQIAFPSAKQPEALEFCKEEIFNYIEDVLFHQTATTLSDPKQCNSEEMESKYIRLIAGCFNGMVLFLTVQNSENNEQLFHKIFSEPKFWKYAKNKDPEIRRAWYSLVTTLSKYYPNILIEHASKVCPLTLGRLGEDNPVVIPVVWDAVLRVITVIDNCWQHVNIAHAFLPPLWIVLNEGGNGNASATFQNLLPLLSKLPASVTEPRIPFYERFYGCLIKGMSNFKGKIIPSELRAIVKAYLECLLYSLQQHLSNTEDDNNCRAHLIKDQLIPLIKDSFTNEEMDKIGFSSFLYNDLSSCIQILENQAQKIEPPQNIILAETLLKFSHLIFEISKELLENETAEQEKNLAKLSLFLNCMFSKVEPGKKKEKSVRFQSEFDDENIVEEPVDNSGILAQEMLKFCKVVFVKLQESPKLSLLKLFCDTVKVSPSNKLFSDLLSAEKDSNWSGSENEAATVFVKTCLFPWLTANKKVLGNEDLVLKCVLSVVLSACTCISEEEALSLLDDLGKNSDPLTLESIIVEAAALREREPKLRKWLKGDFVGKVLVELAENLSKQLLVKDSPTSRIDTGGKLLRVCFTATKDFDSLISSDCINHILKLFTAALANLLPVCSSKQIDLSERIVKIVCDLAVNLFQTCQGCLLLPAVESLLLSFFKLSCCISDPDIKISSILQETWIFGASKLVELQGFDLKTDGFIYQAGMTLNRMLIENKFSYKNLELAMLSDKILCLMELCAKSSKEREELDNKLLERLTSEILRIILPDHENWKKAEADFISKCSFGTLFGCPESAVLPWIDVNLVDLENGPDRCFVYSEVILDVFMKLLTGNMQVILEDLDDIEDNGRFLVPQVFYHLKHLITAIGFAEQSCISSNVPSDHKIRRLYNLFSEPTSQILEMLTSKEIDCIINEISNSCVGGSFAEVKALSIMLDLSMTNTNSNCGKEMEAFITKHEIFRLVAEGNQEAVYTVLKLLPFVSSSYIAEFISLSTNHIISDENILIGRGTPCLDIFSICLNLDRPDVFVMESVQENLTTLLVFFFNLRKTNPNIFIPEWNASENSSEILFISQLCSVFYTVIKRFIHLVTQDYWDLILCSTVGWIEKCCKSESLVLKEELQLPGILVFQLLCLVKQTLQNFNDTSDNSDFVSTLLSEWNELYLENIYSEVIPMFLNLSNYVTKLKYTSAVNKLLNAISHSLEDLSSDLILKCVGQDVKIDCSAKDISLLLKRLYLLLMSGTSRPIVMGSHAIIFSIIDKVPENQLPDDQIETEELRSRCPPKELVSTLESTGQIVEVMLQNFQAGDCCLVQPHTDTFVFTYVYLLSWIQLLKLFGAASSETRSEYAAYLHKSGLLNGLLLNLFRLMPSNPNLSPEKCHSPGSATTMFTEPVNIYYNNWSKSSELQHVSCQVYLLTLVQLPALVRQWWLNQDKRTSEIVNKYTTSYVSSCISFQEIKAVQDSETKFTNMSVKGRPVAREVVAKYTMEEITFELVIRLPPNHPLGPVAIETGQRIGVGMNQWRNWMLQLTTFLTHQNGSILDGLSLWKRNVDKRFEGIEECMICFYVLHGATCQLPKLTCRTCKKKFHPACLYKWFSTSQNSSCPLCRNMF